MTLGAGLPLLGASKRVSGSGERAMPFLVAGAFVSGVAGVIGAWTVRQRLAKDGAADADAAFPRGRLLRGVSHGGAPGGFRAFRPGVSRDGVQRD
ncbi:MAG: hypothetical protein H6895_00170 [Defluviimonas sp.]|uniref:hypothetical protein n=1 Tax=Albidovulum sp. TaxID=1872424 RepID=UPI002A2D0FB5|nr:hypothetical protein [Defluviimonas sp.]